MGWRETQAMALEQLAAELDETLDALDNAHAVLEARGLDGLCQEVRGLAGGLRAEASTMRAEARALLTADRPTDGFPLALTVTTHHARRD